MALPDAGEVVAEDDVEHPVQAVLDRPVLAHHLGCVGRREGARGDEVAVSRHGCGRQSRRESRTG
jgi:hypothetical protein